MQKGMELPSAETKYNGENWIALEKQSTLVFRNVHLSAEQPTSPTGDILYLYLSGGAEHAQWYETEVATEACRGVKLRWGTSTQLDLKEASLLPHVDDQYSHPQLRREQLCQSMEEDEAEKIRQRRTETILNPLSSMWHTVAAQQMGHKTDEIEPTRHKWQPTNSGW
jgi:hypothetical protein